MAVMGSLNDVDVELSEAVVLWVGRVPFESHNDDLIRETFGSRAPSLLSRIDEIYSEVWENPAKHTLPYQALLNKVRSDLRTSHPELSDAAIHALVFQRYGYDLR